MSTMFHPLSFSAPPARRAFVRTSSWAGRVGFFESPTRRRPWPRLARGNPSIIGIRHLIKTTQIITVRWLYVLRSNAQNTEEKEETMCVCVLFRSLISNKFDYYAECVSVWQKKSISSNIILSSYLGITMMEATETTKTSCPLSRIWSLLPSRDAPGSGIDLHGNGWWWKSGT